MAQSAKRFAELLQAGISEIAKRESRTKGAIRDELGYAVDREGGSAIQYWAYGDGHIPKQQADVEALARFLVGRGNLDPTWLTAFLESAGYPHRQELFTELFPDVDSIGVNAGPTTFELHLPIDPIPSKTPLPSVSLMPLKPNPLFVGREEDLRQLAQLLTDDDTAAVSQVDTAATTGLGGMGKTQLACEFVHRYGQFFPGGVFWLSFDKAESVAANITMCGGADHLDLSPDFGERSPAEKVRLVQKAWRDPIPRLLVFDNCEVLDLLTQWRPTSGGCRILITSRRGDWEPTLGVAMVALDVLSRTESLTLLRSYFSQRKDNYADAITEELNAIAEELGDLPLALHLAGSYLRRHPNVAPDAYLNQLRDPALLQHPSMLGGDSSPTGHIQHVGRTFALSYDRLDPHDEIDARAIKLLVHAAHFAPGEPIWYRLLIKTLALDLDDPNDAYKADGAFARLIELGLVEREASDTLRMHRLVARFVRDVAKEQVEATQKAVEKVVFEETASVNREVRPMPLLAWQLHLRSVADIAQVREDEESARLCYELGKHLWQIGDYEGALGHMEKSLSIREQLFGKEHLDVAESLTLLGRIYRGLGKSTASQSFFERALEIRLGKVGECHELTAESLENMGICFRELGNFDQAHHYLQNALDVYQQTLGDEHELTAECYNNFAHCLYVMDDLRNARLYWERAAAINERKLGDRHPRVAVNYHNLGAVLHAMNELGTAKTYIERALTIRRSTYGDAHPDTLVSLAREGLILRDMGALDQAKVTVEQALAFYNDTLGEEHIDTARCRHNLASILQRQGNTDLAIRHQAHAYRVCRSVYGKKHHLTRKMLNYLNELRNSTAISVDRNLASDSTVHVAVHR
ncbi:MAG: FxSxx-COOH system tetratricopeptide repeat protein [Chloroflexota bacterium]